MSRYFTLKLPGLRPVIALLASTALITSCESETSEPEVEPSMNSHDNFQNQSIDVSGGYSQEEQLTEVAIVLAAMREHFGDEVRISDLEPDADELEAVRQEIRPQSCGGDYYRYRVDFEVEERDIQELYDSAEAVASQVGLTPNRNNSSETDIGTMFFGAGSAEERAFLVNTEHGTLTAFYRGRCSDDPSMTAVVQEFSDEYAEEFQEENAPTHLPGYGE